MNDIEKRIEELTNELNYHNHKYYVDDAPEISDFAFDKMLVELEHLEEKYPEEFTIKHKIFLTWYNIKK